MVDAMMKRKRRMPDEERYKVSKAFKKWMDGQIKVMWNYKSIDKWDRIENEIMRESYTFIRGLLK